MHNLPEPVAKFYAAEILLALEHIHSLGIIYCDLKPENVVLDVYGHLKLVDFGLSRFSGSLDTWREGLCGSEGYISPEAVRRESCRFASDFYSLGVVIHEMLSGRLPNRGKRLSSDFDCSSVSMKLPRAVSKSARSLLRGLLNNNPAERLGAKTIKDIKRHKWFREINWSDIEARTITPPFRPSIENPLEYEDALNESTSEDEKDLSEKSESEIE
eukprot:TRINITY_DN7785_c0_g4_i2.p1 TRINITY_DN7785_c0_g4~~TRINITY_DN7785_c0_g4_i2.p1  ORF type:complete len:215 (+),score=29.51 TRINITY_DN7785_c0_g4_i2:873-1517(+)